MSTNSTNHTPPIDNRYKIMIICEGKEECIYIQKLISFHKWNDNLNVFYVDARGNGNLFNKLNNAIQLNEADYYFILCDTGERGSKSRLAFKNLQKKIRSHFQKLGIVRNIVIFANPVTLQIVLSHFKRVKVPYEDKKKNRDYIMSVSGVSGYNGRSTSMKRLVNKISPESYQTMRKNVKSYHKCYWIKYSTNGNKMFKELEKKDQRWINKLRRKMGLKAVYRMNIHKS